MVAGRHAAPRRAVDWESGRRGVRSADSQTCSLPPPRPGRVCGPLLSRPSGEPTLFFLDSLLYTTTLA